MYRAESLGTGGSYWLTRPARVRIFHFRHAIVVREAVAGFISTFTHQTKKLKSSVC